MPIFSIVPPAFRFGVRRSAARLLVVFVRSFSVGEWVFLSHFTASSLRLFPRLDLFFPSGVNVFFGGNASGKTSLLEGIYFLSRVRSFRSSNSRELIRYGDERLVLRAALEDSVGKTWMGIEKARGGTRIQADDERVSRVSDQVLRFPVLSWLPDSASLFTASPQFRRRWLDWSLFHVKPEFLTAWKRYCRALRHRNTVLRRAEANPLSLWEQIMGEAAETIDAMRDTYLSSLQRHWGGFMQGLLGMEARMVYRRGWDASIPLQERLRAQRQSDRVQGYTRSGPHRADIVFYVQDKSVASVLSRGQMKLYGVGMILGQTLYMREQTARTPVLLIDDVDAELDGEASRALFGALSKLSAQCFVTTLCPERVLGLSGFASSLFHMKQGRVELLQ